MLERIGSRRGTPLAQLRSVNIMTPHRIADYRIKPGLYAELSGGTGMRGEDIYGVTVRPDEGTPRLSQLFWSERDARRYLERLADE